jgi:hypothetical protein
MGNCKAPPIGWVLPVQYQHLSEWKRNCCKWKCNPRQVAELAGANLVEEPAVLISFADVDDELAALKAVLLTGSSPSQAQLPGRQTTTPASSPAAPKDAAVDAELEDLKRQLDQL